MRPFAPSLLALACVTACASGPRAPSGHGPWVATWQASPMADAVDLRLFAGE
jgi:hypothetical protein